MLYNKGLLSKDMIELTGNYDEDDLTEEDLYEMMEILSHIHCNDELIDTLYIMAEA